VAHACLVLALFGMEIADAKLTLVLMAGLPGSGKTTLAYALSKLFRWQVVDKDMYKDILVKQKMDNEEASHAAYEISFAILRAALNRQHTSVIFDTAALSRFIIDEVEEIINMTRDVQLKVILCVADYELRHLRISSRPPQPTTIRVNPPTIADYLYHYRHLPQDKLVLDTSADKEACLSEAIRYIAGA